MLMALERRLRPDEAPSIKLKLTSRKPVLSSSTRRPSKSKGGMAAASTKAAAAADPGEPIFLPMSPLHLDDLVQYDLGNIDLGNIDLYSIAAPEKR